MGRPRSVPSGPTTTAKHRRVAPSRRRSCPESPFARGAAQLERQRHLRRRSAISARPQARPAGEICARHEGGPVRARVARGTPIQPRPLTIDPTLACPSSSPAFDWYLALPGGANILRVRTKIFLLQAVGVSSISSLRTVMRELGRGELGVGGKAHYGGAYDRTQVRTRVNPGAWQGLQRRLKAPSHRAAPALPT